MADTSGINIPHNHSDSKACRGEPEGVHIYIFILNCHGVKYSAHIYDNCIIAYKYKIYNS